MNVLLNFCGQKHLKYNCTLFLPKQFVHFFPHILAADLRIADSNLLFQPKCDAHKRSALNRCVFSNKIYPCDSTKELLRCADGAQVHKEHLVLSLLLARAHLWAAIFFFGDSVICEAECGAFPRRRRQGCSSAAPRP